jgi:aldose 1-epimerase
MADGGRGQPLLPWPNRLQDGRYEFRGRQYQLPIDEVARNNASHGLTRWLNWSAVFQSKHEVRLRHVLHPRPGYPFALDLEVEYVLTEQGLVVRTRARNAGTQPLPFGAGQHPYFTVGTRLVDEATLAFSAESRLELDPARRLPTMRALPVSASEYDFAAGKAIGELVIDDCFTDLARDTLGRATVMLTNTRNGHSVRVWMDEKYKFMQLFTGDTLAPERRRQGLAIEPMSCPPNAFRTGIELIVLEPSQEVQLTWGVELTMV